MAGFGAVEIVPGHVETTPGYGCGGPRESFPGIAWLERVRHIGNLSPGLRIIILLRGR